jgi:hypothetical protein
MDYNGDMMVDKDNAHPFMNPYGGFLSHGGSPNPAWVEDGPYGFV